MKVLVQEAPFDVGAVTNEFTASAKGAGAIVTFTGVVREADTGEMSIMEIEHYPGMTQKALEEIASEAISRWSLANALVIHRHGRLAPGDQIMMVATASRHRKDAFEAAEFLMDYLKSRAPFWKKEILSDGSADWVAAKDADEDALKRW